jgi:hypothetical protein
MKINTFENCINNKLKEKGWETLLITKKIKSSAKIDLTDHDVVVYKKNSNRLIILEIQCKDEIKYLTFKFGKSTDMISKFGFFSCNQNFMPHFREVDSTDRECFIDWIYDFNKKMVDRENQNPLTQLFCSVIDTLTQIRDNKNLFKYKSKEIIIFPIILYSKLKSNFYFLRIEPSIQFYDKMKDYVKEKYDAFIPRSVFPFLLMNKKGLLETNILDQLEQYLDYPNLFNTEK